MKFKIRKSTNLDEAQFHGYNHLLRHFDKHVLKDGEESNYTDPKFPQMTKQEYADRAEALSLADAQPVLSKDELHSARGIVGWKTYDPRWGIRCIKMNLNPKDYPGYIEHVSYIDEKSDDQIFSYMLCRKSRKYREFDNKIAELPENEEKVKKILADREAKEKEQE